MNEQQEALADAIRKYEYCQSCGEELQEFNFYDEFGEWEYCELCCQECDNTIEIN
jgi:hypothetical protein